jgi:hypothetical protein
MDKSRHNFGIFTEYEHQSKQAVVLKLHYFFFSSSHKLWGRYLIFSISILLSHIIYIVNLFQILVLNIEFLHIVLRIMNKFCNWD